MLKLVPTMRTPNWIRRFCFVALASLLSTVSLAKADSKFAKSIELSNKGDESFNTIRASLKAGADPNSFDEDGYPAIYWAIFNRDAKVLKLLLESGADPNLHDKKEDWSPLMHAAYFAAFQPLYDRAVGILISHHAAINDVSNKNCSALMAAVSHSNNKNKSPPVVEYLLQKGADPNIGTSPNPKMGEITPLMEAARKGNLAVVKILLKHHARTDLKDANTSEGKTALQIAKDSNHIDVEMLLQSVSK